jgi:putative cell wall-binding protein
VIQSSYGYSLHGQNRYETSVKISRFGWPNQSDTLVLGRGDVPIDALTGGVLAKKFNAPMLLTAPKQIPSIVEQEIHRLNPTRIYLLGGESAISNSIQAKLKEQGYQVIRIAGQNRYDTSVQVAKHIVNSSNQIFLTTGTNSPDPLSIAPYAGMKQIPILLSNKNQLPTEVSNYVKQNGITKVTLIGGETVLSNDIIKQLRQLGITDISRLSGVDRYQTSIAIVNHYRDQFDVSKVFFASGLSFVDALSGAPLAALNSNPILLTHRDYLPPSVSNWIGENNLSNVIRPYFLGGYSVIGIKPRVDYLQ